MSPPPEKFFCFVLIFQIISKILPIQKKTSHCSVDLSLLAIFSLNAISYLYKKNLRPDRSKTFMYRGWGIRTPIDGFGDRCSAIELIPYINKNTCTFKTTYCITSELLFITWTTVGSSSSCSFTRTTNALSSVFAFHARQSLSAFGQALDLLVTVSCMRYRTSTSALSTLSSSRGLTAFAGISHLEGGFTLRCLQRLSRPDLATRPCSWWTTDAPEVSPSRSSRTKDSSSQISYAHAG